MGPERQPPAAENDAPSHSLAWHAFDAIRQDWAPVTTAQTEALDHSPSSHHREFTLVTWNVDGLSPKTELRIGAIIPRILALQPEVDIVFLQEVSREALAHVLRSAEIREGWYVSEPDASNWIQGIRFATATLLSRGRFNAQGIGLGPVWRVNFPSYFKRDALCCDVLVPGKETTRLRLVNVHLDSLAIANSLRPRQVGIAASLLRSTGCGIIAGDFNPVQPFDGALVETNGLTDAWTQLRGSEPGYTWGIDGAEPYPPNRLDKIAMLGVEALEIDIMHPEMMKLSMTAGDAGAQVPWSDHSGLRCRFRVSSALDD